MLGCADNFDNFLVPVATAFGEYDGNQRLGMLKRSELDLLTEGPTWARKGLRGGAAARSGTRAGWVKRAEAKGGRLRSTMATQTRRLGTRLQRSATASLESFSNSRGDVSSSTS